MTRDEALSIILAAAEAYAELQAADDNVSPDEQAERDQLWAALELFTST